MCGIIVATPILMCVGRVMVGRTPVAFFLLLAAMVAVGCRASPVSVELGSTGVPTATPVNRRVVGVVVQDADDGHRLAGAVVQVGDERYVTDRHGRCWVRVLSDGPSTVEVMYPGYVRWRGVLPESSLQVLLVPNKVEVQVRGHGGALLSDAQVTHNGKRAVPGSDGRFTLRRMRVGDTIKVEHPAYESRQVSFDGGSLLRLSLTPLSVTVEVHDAMTGQAVPGVSVCTEDENCRRTGADGQVTLRPVRRGIVVTARRKGYREASTSYDGGSLALELTPTELRGTVRDAISGRPLTNTVLLVDGRVVPLDAKGRYYIPDITRGYTVFVKSPGYKRVTMQIGPGTDTSRYDALDPCREPSELPCADINLQRFAVHGIYINFNLLWARERLLELIDLVDRSPVLNAIVVDVKGDYGYVAFETDDPVIASGGAMVEPFVTLDELVRMCRERHIYTIARMVVFKDNELIKARPELAVRHPDGRIFYDREGLAWADPTRKEVWEYNIAITREVIRIGFDEVQYDYLRYPSDSTSLAIVRALVYSVPSTLESRTAAIAGFVAAAKKAVDPTPAFLSADLFGYALSVNPEHDMRIGQRLKDIAPHVDYVCPMVYPSTFIPGNLGLASPPDHPYEVVAISMDYGTQRTHTPIRPWLQHYWYGRHELAAQRRAAEEKSRYGWCYWNAGGVYDELFFVPPKGLRP